MTSAANGSCNLALLPIQERQAIEQHKAACLERHQAAQQLASSIFSTKARQGWRVQAERLLKANPELEQAARQMLNRMMKK